MTEQAYFLTVDWCNKGARGVFCGKDGSSFRKERPHTEIEMLTILGPFWIILKPKSELFTYKELEEYTRWRSLDEYSGQYGIALKEVDSESSTE